MNEFLTFFDEQVRNFPMHLAIDYSKTCGWLIEVTKRGCAEDYPKCKHNEHGDVLIVCENEFDLELVFAKAQIALKEWILEYEGGY